VYANRHGPDVYVNWNTQEAGGLVVYALVPIPQAEFLGNFLSFDFFFHKIYLRIVNSLQGEYASSLSILSMYEFGCILVFLPYLLHHIGYKKGYPPLPICCIISSMNPKCFWVLRSMVFPLGT
jgi:hypothetical protein